MKPVLLILAILAVPAAIAKKLSDDPEVKTIMTACEAQAHPPQQHLDMLRIGVGIDCPDLRAYALCMFKKLGYINDDGVLQIDDLKKDLKIQFTEEQTQKIIDACAKQSSAPERTAYEAMLCMYKKKKEL